MKEEFEGSEDKNKVKKEETFAKSQENKEGLEEGLKQGLEEELEKGQEEKQEVKEKEIQDFMLSKTIEKFDEMAFMADDTYKILTDVTISLSLCRICFLKIEKGQKKSPFCSLCERLRNGG